MNPTQTTIRHKPNPAQMRWHRATRQHRKVLLGAGVGVGKTEAIAFRAVMLAVQNAGLAGLVVSHVYAHVKNEIRPRIKKFLKQANIYAGENIADKAIFVTNGSVIYYGSADKPSSMEGRDVAWALGDEIRFWKREAYDFFCARVRTKTTTKKECASTVSPSITWITNKNAHNIDNPLQKTSAHRAE